MLLGRKQNAMAQKLRRGEPNPIYSRTNPAMENFPSYFGRSCIVSTTTIEIKVQPAEAVVHQLRKMMGHGSEHALKRGALDSGVNVS